MNLRLLHDLSGPSAARASGQPIDSKNITIVVYDFMVSLYKDSSLWSCDLISTTQGKNPEIS